MNYFPIDPRQIPCGTAGKDFCRTAPLYRPPQLKSLSVCVSLWEDINGLKGVEMEKIKGKIKYIFLGIALLSLIYGIMNGDMLDVLKKAAMICLECIGIG